MSDLLDDFLLLQRGTTIVNLWDDATDACRFMDAVMEELELRARRPVTVVRLLLDENRAWARAHCVEGTPALLVFRDGRLHLVVRGRMDLDGLLKRLLDLGL